MKSILKGALVTLCAIGIFAGAIASAQERSKHVLHDAATGKIKPAKINVQVTVTATPFQLWNSPNTFVAIGTLTLVNATTGKVIATWANLGGPCYAVYGP